MPVAALQAAVVQGLEERPALVEEVFNLLPLRLGVGFWGWWCVEGDSALQSILRCQQTKRIVFQHAATDEYFVGFSNCSEEKSNRH